MVVVQPEYAPPPGAVAQPTQYVPPPPDATTKPVGEHVQWRADHSVPVLALNILNDVFRGEPKPEPTPAPAPAAPLSPPPPEVAPAPTAAPVSAVTPVVTAARRPRRGLIAAIVTVAVLLVGGGVMGYVLLKPKPAPVTVRSAAPTPTLAPSVTPSTTPPPTPSPTSSPSPTPSPTPALAVTLPAEAPTASKPQPVTVTSPSGLWLRSSATSASRSNIIGWMPKGAVVQVDSVGDFWWHGTYRGQTGYFASKYTN